MFFYSSREGLNNPCHFESVRVLWELSEDCSSFVSPMHYLPDMPWSVYKELSVAALRISKKCTCTSQSVSARDGEKYDEKKGTDLGFLSNSFLTLQRF